MAYSKGQIITMNLDGTDRDYRILNLNGNIAEVVAMFDPNVNCQFNGDEENTYSGGDLDTYLNTTWYGGLTTTAKNAIVSKTLTQYQYSYNSSVYNATTHASYADYSTKSVKASGLSRKVYALDVEDIENYFNHTFSTADIWELFWNVRSKPTTVTYPWLRSARAGSSDYAWCVRGDLGYVGGIDVVFDNAARPAFTIDLSKIFPPGYSITYHANGGAPEPVNLTGQTNLPSPLPPISKSGHRFDGWFTNSTFTTPAVAGATIEADTDLYAKFTRTHITLDLSTIGLPAGIHSIQMKLSDDGATKRDSALSNAVTYTVQPSGGYDFANDSWATIAQYIKAGTDHYSLGDTKTDTVTIGGNTYTATFKIVDDTVGRYVTQSGTSHKVIEMQELVGDSDGYGIMWHDRITPNSNNTFLMAAAPSSGPIPPPPTADGTSFADCSLFRYLNNTIIDYLPSDLKAVLETTTVYSGDGNQTASASTNVAATGKIFLPCATELYGDELHGSLNYGFANSSEGTPQFTYYSSIGVTTDIYDALTKYMIEHTSYNYYYWLRSPYDVAQIDARACIVENYGFLNIDYVDFGGRVSLCFAW